MLDTCMERIETCDSATWSSLPVPKSEAKEERVLLLVYLLVEVHVVDPSIIVLLGSEGARIQMQSQQIEILFRIFISKNELGSYSESP